MVVVCVCVWRGGGASILLLGVGLGGGVEYIHQNLLGRVMQQRLEL